MFREKTIINLLLYVLNKGEFSLIKNGFDIQYKRNSVFRKINLKSR